MNDDKINRVGVVGSGTMGNGIAQVSAMAGCDVCLVDLNQEQLDRALSQVKSNLEKGVARGKVDADVAIAAFGRISTSTSMDALANADLIIEAVPEILTLKLEIFSNLDTLTKATCILASNTSSLPITEIAAIVADPSRVIGMHFFNPVHINKLLEIVTHDGTSAKSLERAHTFAKRIGKSAITVKDSPGFASSRLGIALGMEAIRMVEEGVASPEDIDTAMTLGYRHPMGPLKLTDLVGVDVRMAIGDYLAEALDNDSFQPPQLMRDMVAAGKLGQKSGSGFYEW